MRLVLILVLLAGIVFFQANRNDCVWRGLDHVEEWTHCIFRI